MSKRQDARALAARNAPLEGVADEREFAASEDPVISVRDLEVEFPTVLGRVHPLNGISFDVPRGKVIGVVGESGCGKSVTARSIMQIIEKPGRIVGGSITFHRGAKAAEQHADIGGEIGAEAAEVLTATDVEITSLSPGSAQMRAMRGSEIAMIFQEPMSSLNPVHPIGRQIEEAILLHQTKDKSIVRQRTIDILRQVSMPNPERIATTFPHQLSGGMRQRAMIAMALSCEPSVLIADEPTTALDVTTEAQILSLMRRLREEIGMSIMFITHNMGVVAQMCDDVAVMYLGRIVERGPVEEIFYNPKHPYTQSLLRSIPRMGATRGKPLEVIHGSVPDPYSTVRGCGFHPRCPEFMPGLCDVREPGERDTGGNHQSARCYLYSHGAPLAAARRA